MQFDGLSLCFDIEIAMFMGVHFQRKLNENDPMREDMCLSGIVQNGLVRSG